MKTEKVKFLTSSPQVVLQDIKRSFKRAHLDAKNYWNLPASLWNSTNVTTLLRRCSGSREQVRKSFLTTVMYGTGTEPVWPREFLAVHHCSSSFDMIVRVSPFLNGRSSGSYCEKKNKINKNFISYEKWLWYFIANNKNFVWEFWQTEN